MLAVLVLALEVMDRETHPLGLTINWAKAIIQNLDDQDGANQMQYTTVRGNQVEVVESFTYLGSLIHISDSSEPQVKRQINIVREAHTGSEYMETQYYCGNQAAPLQGGPN